MDFVCRDKPNNNNNLELKVQVLNDLSKYFKLFTVS